MYTLNFISNDYDCYWYEVFDHLIDAIKAAHKYGSKNDFYHVYDSEHKLIFTGRI